MSDYYGTATLEDWLAEEVFEMEQVPPEVVALFERYREGVEHDIESWMESDDGDGNPLSWRGWGRGFNTVDDDFEAIVANAKALLLTHDAKGPPMERQLTNLSTYNLVLHVDRTTTFGFTTPSGRHWLYDFPNFIEVATLPDDCPGYNVNNGATALLQFTGVDAPLSALYVFSDNSPFRVITYPSRESFGTDCQKHVKEWTYRCFDHVVANDLEERNHRFFEEAVELVQAGGYTQEQAHAMIDYVYERPVSAPENEVGGVTVTLMALCMAHEIDLVDITIEELYKIEKQIDVIRKKWRTKPDTLKGPSAKDF